MEGLPVCHYRILVSHPLGNQIALLLYVGSHNRKHEVSIDPVVSLQQPLRQEEKTGASSSSSSSRTWLREPARGDRRVISHIHPALGGRPVPRKQVLDEISPDGMPGERPQRFFDVHRLGVRGALGPGVGDVPLEVQVLGRVHGAGGSDPQSLGARLEHGDSVHRRRSPFLYLLLVHPQDSQPAVLQHDGAEDRRDPLVEDPSPLPLELYGTVALDLDECASPRRIRASEFDKARN
eukprot:752274-Hanusia_phi.AAC.3